MNSEKYLTQYMLNKGFAELMKEAKNAIYD